MRVECKNINNDYSMLLLFSDGITDILPDKRIEYIIQNCFEELICKELVNYSKCYSESNIVLPYDEFYDTIISGKDNASSIVYVRRKNEQNSRKMERTNS